MTASKIDPNGNNKAENLIALADYHHQRMLASLMTSSAKLCIDDAMSLYNRGQYDDACAAALRSLKYSIGILHVDYIAASKAKSFADVPQYPETPTADPARVSVIKVGASPVDLHSLHYYLDIAHDVIEGKTKKLSDPYRPTKRERQVCMLWAMWMATWSGVGSEERAKCDGTPVKSVMDKLREALREVRDNEAVVDLRECKVFCKTAGHVLDFGMV